MHSTVTVKFAYWCIFTVMLLNAFFAPLDQSGYLYNKYSFYIMYQIYITYKLYNSTCIRFL